VGGVVGPKAQGAVAEERRLIRRWTTLLIRQKFDCVGGGEVCESRPFLNEGGLNLTMMDLMFAGCFPLVKIFNIIIERFLQPYPD